MGQLFSTGMSPNVSCSSPSRHILISAVLGSQLCWWQEGTLGELDVAVLVGHIFDAMPDQVAMQGLL